MLSFENIYYEIKGDYIDRYRLLLLAVICSLYLEKKNRLLLLSRIYKLISCVISSRFIHIKEDKYV